MEHQAEKEVKRHKKRTGPRRLATATFPGGLCESGHICTVDSRCLQCKGAFLYLCVTSSVRCRGGEDHGTVSGEHRPERD